VDREFMDDLEILQYRCWDLTALFHLF
jgi:hypothetical protein